MPVRKPPVKKSPAKKPAATQLTEVILAFHSSSASNNMSGKSGTLYESAYGTTAEEAYDAYVDSYGTTDIKDLVFIRGVKINVARHVIEAP